MEHHPPQSNTQWMPFRTDEILYCLTPLEHVEVVLKQGLLPRVEFLEFPAVSMAYSVDPLYEPVHRFSVEACKRAGEPVARLHIRTKNALYRSLFPNRTYQIISLDPIKPSDIVHIETV